MKNYYRHGDIMLKEVDALPLGKTTSHHTLTIALGEATGHHHSLFEIRDVEYTKAPIEYLNLDDGRFLIIHQPVLLRHQEHHELRIEPGIYEITEEREYDYFEESMKKVVD